MASPYQSCNQGIPLVIPRPTNILIALVICEDISIMDSILSLNGCSKDAKNAPMTTNIDPIIIFKLAITCGGTKSCMINNINFCANVITL